MAWLVLLASVFGLVFSGLWLAIALGASAFIVYYFLAHGAQATIGVAAWHSIQMYSLVAVGCFILMGQIVLRSGVSKKIYDSMSPLLERLPGGLLHTNIFTCAMFAAIFGSSAATAAVVGSAGLPELRARHYDDGMALGTIAAGGTLGIMIPPSAAFIIYGSLTEVSIGALFAAGILPGIMLAVMFSAYIVVKAMRNPRVAPRSESSLTLAASLRRVAGVWPLAVLILAVLVPILSGWTTATESSAFGVIGGIILGKFYGNLTIKSLIDSVKEATHTYVMLMFVVCGAMILAIAAGLIGLPRQLVLLVTGLDVPRSAIMVGLIVMYVALGCLFDGISFLVMTLPFVFPIISGLEYGGIWFGVLMVILIEIGQLTPPVGVNLYVVQAIAGKGTSLEHVVRGIWPFFWILLIGAIIVLLFPQIATLLPSTFGFEII